MSLGPVRQDLSRGAGTRGRPYTLRASTNSPTKAKSGLPPQVPASPTLGPRYPVPSTPSLMFPTIANKPLDLGMPTKQQYNVLEREYIESLNARKREKALLCQSQFDMIWEVLHEPTAARVSTPQFRWWVRKMFVLSYPSGALSDAELASIGADPEARTELPVVLHQDRPVALKEQIYDILCYCHHLSNHGGRDRTTAAVREHYSWIPKDLIARFVKVCPTCIYKKTRNPDVITSSAASGDDLLVKLEAQDRLLDPVLEAENVPPPMTILEPHMSRAAPLAVYEVSGCTNGIPSDVVPPWPPSAGPAYLPQPVSRSAMESVEDLAMYPPIVPPVSMRVSMPVYSRAPGGYLPPLHEPRNLSLVQHEQPVQPGTSLMLPSLSQVLIGLYGDSANTDTPHGTANPLKLGSRHDYVPQIDPALLQDDRNDVHEAAQDLSTSKASQFSSDRLLSTVSPAALLFADARRRMDIASLLNTPRPAYECEPPSFADAELSYPETPPPLGLRPGFDDVFYAGSPVLSVSHAVSYERLSALAGSGAWDADILF